MHMCLHEFMCSACVQDPSEAGREHAITASWSFGWLWAALWVLGTKPGSFARTVSSLHWAVSLAPCYFFPFNSMRAGTETEALRNVACFPWLAQPASLYNPGPHVEVALPIVHWALPHQSRKCPTGLPAGLSHEHNFLIDISSFQMTPVCVKLTKINKNITLGKRKLISKRGSDRSRWVLDPSWVIKPSSNKSSAPHHSTWNKSNDQIL